MSKRKDRDARRIDQDTIAPETARPLVKLYLEPPSYLKSAIAALQVGIAIIDANRRIVLMNPAFLSSLGLPPGSFPPGTPVEDAVRSSALRGVYGPGNPEAQVAAIMAPDRSRAGRLR